MLPNHGVMTHLVTTALKTCAEMVEDRGFVVHNVDPEADVAMTAFRDDDELQVRFYTTELRIGVKAVRALQADVAAHPRSLTILIVTANGATPYTRKEVVNDTRLEFWTFSRLQYNITHFRIVPRHSLVTLDDVAALKKQYHISNDTQWPSLKQSDAVCQYFAFPINSIVRIDRVFGNVAHPYYRRVVA